jgi:hypothetical protein
MNDELLKQQAAEIEAEMYGSFANPAEVSDEDTGTEEAMIETEPMETEPVKAEINENATPAAMTVAGHFPMQFPSMMPSAPQVWMPCLPSSLSAQTLFNLALTVEAPDPARQALGFFYEQELKRECEMLIPHPIPSYYRAGIWKALMLRRSNPGYFVCNAIDVVLTYYLNNYYPEDNDVFR